MKPPKLLLLSVSLAVAAATQAEILERVVARVNGDVVTLSEFEARQLAAVQQGRVSPAEIETYLRENNARLLQEAIDDMLILQRGAELGIKLRPEYIQEVIDGIKKENNIADDAELQRQLRREGMSLDDLKRNIERSIVRRQVLSRELEAKATVNEAEARAEYERNKESHTRKASVHLQEIVVPDEEQARALVVRARAGEDFAGMAREHSTAASKRRRRRPRGPAPGRDERGGGGGGVPPAGGRRVGSPSHRRWFPDHPRQREEGRVGGVVRRGQGRDRQAPFPGAGHGRLRRVPGGAPQERGDPDHGHRGPAAGEPPRRGHGDDAAAVRRRHHRVARGPGRGVRHHPANAPRARRAAVAARGRRAVPGPVAVSGAARSLAMGRPDFFARVYAAVRAIPRGRVATYGQVAAILGVPRGARAVGWALRALSPNVKPKVPWHRVVGAGGRISPRAGPGPELQRRRLRAEGVTFRGALIDLRRHGVARLR